jgi:hypothetical protein
MHVRLEITKCVVQKYQDHSALPNTENTVSSALDEIPISYSYTLDNGRRLSFFCLGDSGPAVPLPTLYLIVYFHNVLSSGAYNPARIEHHARNRVVIRISIVDRPCPKIPYLSSALSARSLAINNPLE